MKNRVIILTAALLFAMSLSAHAQISGILDRAKQVLDAIDGTSSNQTQQPSNTQSTQPQPTLEKLKLTLIDRDRAYRVSAENNSISGAVVIPDTYNGIPVTSIVSRGFQNCTGMTSISIPASINRIDSGSFDGCTNLTSVTFFSEPTGISIDALARFPGDLVNKYRAVPNGGAGTYTRSAGSNTWTKQSSIAIAPTPVNTSLNGIWEDNSGTQITFSGSGGTFSRIGSYGQTSWGDAVNKGYIKLGDQYLRNVSSTGNLTWSGQALGVTNNSNNRNVATGTQWINGTITMSADGRTITISSTGSSGNTLNTFTRR